MVVFGGRVVFVGLSFVATSLVLRKLDAASVGAYWFCLAAAKIITGCLSDSLDLVVLRSVPNDLEANRPKALDTLRASFWLRLLTVGLIGFAVAMFPRPLSELAFKRPDYSHLLWLTTAALGGEMLIRSVMGYFQSCLDFNRLIVLDIIVQSSRFLAVAVLLAAGALSLPTALGAYLLAPFVAFAVAFFLLPADLRRPRAASLGEFLAVLRYSRWVIAGMALAAVYERLDVILLGLLRGPAEVGVYAPAVMLASTPELVVSVVLTVVNPRVARYYEAGRFNELVSGYLRYSVPIGTCAILGALFLGGPIITALFGAKYSNSIGLFKILAIGTLCFYTVTPVYSALLSILAPKRVLLATTFALSAVSLGGLLAIPNLGATGAAAVLTAVRILMSGLIVFLAQGVLKRAITPAPAAARVGVPAV